MDLNNVMIGSEDPQPLVDFYTKIFGEPGWSDGGYTGWRIGAGGLMIGPHDQVKGKNAQPGRLIWNLETDDVRGEFDRIAATGATVVHEPYSPAATAPPTSCSARSRTPTTTTSSSPARWARASAPTVRRWARGPPPDGSVLDGAQAMSRRANALEPIATEPSAQPISATAPASGASNDASPAAMPSSEVAA